MKGSGLAMVSRWRWLVVDRRAGFPSARSFRALKVFASDESFIAGSIADLAREDIVRTTYEGTYLQAGARYIWRRCVLRLSFFPCIVVPTRADRYKCANAGP